METSTIIWVVVIAVIALVGVGAFSKMGKDREDE